MNKFLVLTLSAFFYSAILCAHTEKYEAENATFDGKVDTKHAGFSGAGFVDMDAKVGSYIEFTVCMADAGAQDVSFVYAHGKDEDRSCKLLVNDTEVISSFAFPKTGDGVYTNYSESEKKSITLNKGFNKIKLVSINVDGPNLDYMNLTGNPCARYTLTTNATNGGSVNVVPQGSTFFDGEEVTLTAVGTNNIDFINWSGDATGTSETLPVTMNGNKNITANFNTVQTFKLTINKTGTGSIALNPESDGNIYKSGVVVELTAKAPNGGQFNQWGGDLSGTELTKSITMDENKTVTAEFTTLNLVGGDRPVGFASVNADNQDGTSGGATYTYYGTTYRSDTIYVGCTDSLALVLYNRLQTFKTWYKNRLSSPYPRPEGPLTIVLLPGVYNEPTGAAPGTTLAVQKQYGNKMLDVAETADVTIVGSNNVVMNEFGFNIKKVRNIIIRNITFICPKSNGGDGINIGYPETHHIWVDRCTFWDGPGSTSLDERDGALDIKNGANFITVSWCKFMSHRKTCLLGHSDNNGSADKGKLKTTYYANWFDGTYSRQPRVRFAETHVLNNLYTNVGMGREGHLGPGIAAACESQVLAEGNFFHDCVWPMFVAYDATTWKTIYGSNLSSPSGNKPGKIKILDNKYEDSGLTNSLVGKVNDGMLNPSKKSIKFDEEATDWTFNINNYYTYAPMDADDVRDIIPLYAGADRDVNIPADDEAPTAPTNLTASQKTIRSVELNWTASTDNIGVAGYKVYRNNISVGTANSNQYTDNSGISVGNTYTYHIVAFDMAGNYSENSNTSSVTLVPSNDTEPPTAPGNLSATQNNDYVELNWSASTDNEEVVGYKVYRGEDELGITTKLNYTDGDIIEGETYTYTVYAYDAAENVSAVSNTATLTVDNIKGETGRAPKNLNATLIADGTKILLKWSPSGDEDVAGYMVYRNNSLRTSTTEHTYIDEDIVSNTSYTYYVTCYNSSNEEGAASEEVSAGAFSGSELINDNITTGWSSSKTFDVGTVILGGGSTASMNGAAGTGDCSKGYIALVKSGGYIELPTLPSIGEFYMYGKSGGASIRDLDIEKYENGVWVKISTVTAPASSTCGKLEPTGVIANSSIKLRVVNNTGGDCRIHHIYAKSGGSITTVPAVISSAPFHYEENVECSTNRIILTFDKNVALGTGTASLSCNSKVIAIGNISINGNSVNIPINESLSEGTLHTLSIPEGLIVDATDATKSQSHTLNFTTKANNNGDGEPTSVNTKDSKIIYVYPNPVSNTLIIVNNKDYKQARVINTYGNVLKIYPLNAGANIYDVSYLPKGIYFIQLSNNKTAEVYQIIKN